MKTTKQILNQRGFTLMEIMVTVGLMGGLAVASMALFKSQGQSQKTVEQNYDATALVNEIRAILSDQTNCKTNFENKAPNLPNALTAVSKTKSGVTTTLYPQNSTLPGTKVKIVSYDLTNTHPGLIARETMLIIRFQRTDAALQAVTPRFVKINYTPDGSGNIATCTASSAGSGGGDLWKASTVTPTSIYYNTGFVGVGTSAPDVGLDVAGTLRAYSVGNSNHIYSDVFSSLGHTPAFYTRRARGTKGSPAYVQANDFLGVVTFRNHTASAGADVGGIASENHTASASGTSMIFRTTPNGTIANSERMIITHNGLVGMGTLTPQRLLHVNGAMRITSGLLPTTNLSAGEIAMDSTDSGMKYYSGTAWQPIAGVRYPKDDVLGASIAGGFRSLQGQDLLASRPFSNTAYGNHALARVNTTNALNNTAIPGGGFIADGSDNFVSGPAAGEYIYGGTQNVFVGHSAAYGNGNSSDGNVAIGANAINNSTLGGDNNVALGRYAGANLNNGWVFPGGSGNVLLGNEAGVFVTGSENIMIGYHQYSGPTNGVTSGSRNIMIGKDVAPSDYTGNDQMNIGNLLFGTSLTQGATISTGRIGISNQNPQGTLHISSPTNTNDIYFTTPSSALRILNDPSGTNFIQSGSTTTSGSLADLMFTDLYNSNLKMRIRAGGDVEASAQITFGSSVVANAYAYTSDRRLKHDIHTYKNALGQVLKLRGVQFTWNKKDVEDVGFIAQEVEKVEPLLVTSDEKGIKAVKYGNIAAMIVEAIKELHQMVVKLMESDRDQVRALASLDQQLAAQESRLKAHELAIAAKLKAVSEKKKKKI